MLHAIKSELVKVPIVIYFTVRHLRVYKDTNRICRESSSEKKESHKTITLALELYLKLSNTNTAVQ